MRVVVAIMLAAIGGCAAPAGTPAATAGRAGGLTPVAAPTRSIGVPWHLVSSARDSASIVIRYQIGGCFRTPRISVAESAGDVTIGVTLVTDAGEGAICAADLADRTRAVTLSRPLGDRALRHAP